MTRFQDEIAALFRASGVVVIASHEDRRGTVTCILEGTGEILGRLGVGNEKAWKQMILDNAPRGTEIVTVLVSQRTNGNGEVRVLGVDNPTCAGRLIKGWLAQDDRP